MLVQSQKRKGYTVCNPLIIKWELTGSNRRPSACKKYQIDLIIYSYKYKYIDFQLHIVLSILELLHILSLIMYIFVHIVSDNVMTYASHIIFTSLHL
jgi:hypothetical protein